MTYFDARPNENDSNSSPVQMTLLDGRPNDIFRRPTKLQIFIPDQMIYFDARPNDLFSNPRQMTYFDARPNGISLPYTSCFHDDE